jgi:hypothetical protein
MRAEKTSGLNTITVDANGARLVIAESDLAGPEGTTGPTGAAGQTGSTGETGVTGVAGNSEYSWFVESPEVKTYTVAQAVSFAGSIVDMVSKTTVGSVTWTVKINGTIVTGLSAQQSTSTEATDVATASNTLVPGDTITIEVSASTGSDWSFSLRTTG